MAPYSSTLAWKIPWTQEPGGPQSMGSLRVGQDSATSLSLFTFMHWKRKWQPTPVFLPGESQGRGSLVGCRLWGRTESDMTEATQLSIAQHSIRAPGSLQSTVSESDSHKGLEKHIDSCTLRTESEPLWGVVRIPTVNRFPQDNLYAAFNRKTTQEVQNSRQTSLFFLFTISTLTFVGFPGGSAVKNPPANAGDACLIPGLERSPGEVNGNSLQYSCLENPKDRKA